MLERTATPQTLAQDGPRLRAAAGGRASASQALVVAGILLLASELAACISRYPLPRCGLDRWFAWGAGAIGLPSELPLACLTMGALLVWFRWRGEAFRPQWRDMAHMAGEAALAGAVLSLVARAVRLLWLDEGAQLPAGALAWQGWWPTLVQGPAVVSAAVHEEVLFRLGLLGSMVYALRCRGIHAPLATWSCVLAVAIVFAGAHFSLLNPAGQSFEWSGFTCHLGLGAALGAMFLWRGLAMAILVHAAFNICALI